MEKIRSANSRLTMGVSFVILATTLSGPLLAKSPDLKRPQIFTDVIECRAIVDDAARLICYDKNVSALDTAQRDETLIVAEKADVQEAKKGLFGLALSEMTIFSGGKKNQVNEVTSTIAKIQKVARDVWVFVLEDGAKWKMTEAKSIGFPPKLGQSIVIKKAAMGSFRAKINGNQKVRVRRIN